MAQTERYGNRDLTYSAWHRRDSTRRYVGIELAQSLAMIDVDVCLWLENDDDTKDLLVVVETAKDVGQPYKPATITRKLAARCRPEVAAYVVLYQVIENPELPSHFIPGTMLSDIAGFRVKRLHPKEEKEWRQLTPDAWCKELLRARQWAAKLIDEDHRRNIDSIMAAAPAMAVSKSA